MRWAIVWEWTQGAGLEHCVIESGSEGMEVCGVVVADWQGSTLALHYRLQCDAQWCFRQASIRATHAGTHREVTLERDAARVWRVGGEVAPALAGCEEVDLMATPLTNSLPVKRLQLAPGKPQQFDVAWIRVPDLSVVRSRQEYTRLDEAPGLPRRIRYRSVETDFRAELSLDADAWVIDYPPYWRRRDAGWRE